MAVKWDGFPAELIPRQRNDAVRSRLHPLESGDGVAFRSLSTTSQKQRFRIDRKPPPALYTASEGSVEALAKRVSREAGKALRGLLAVRPADP